MMNSAETVNPATLPSVPLGERHALPNGSGIYFALNAQNDVLYVGKAASLVKRWRNHHRRAQLEREGDVRVAWWLWDDPTSMRVVEQMLIARFRPALNRAPVVPFTAEEIEDKQFKKASARFFWFYGAVARVNPDGAELLFRDFKARHYAMKYGDLIKGGNRDEMLGDALNIMADAVRCRENSAMFQLKAARVIRVLEWLLIERSQ